MYVCMYVCMLPFRNICSCSYSFASTQHHHPTPQCRSTWEKWSFCHFNVKLSPHPIFAKPAQRLSPSGIAHHLHQACTPAAEDQEGQDGPGKGRAPSRTWVMGFSSVLKGGPGSGVVRDKGQGLTARGAHPAHSTVHSTEGGPNSTHRHRLRAKYMDNLLPPPAQPSTALLLLLPLALPTTDTFQLHPVPNIPHMRTSMVPLPNSLPFTVQHIICS